MSEGEQLLRVFRNNVGTVNFSVIDMTKPDTGTCDAYPFDTPVIAVGEGTVRYVDTDHWSSRYPDDGVLNSQFYGMMVSGKLELLETGEIVNANATAIFIVDGERQSYHNASVKINIAGE